MSWGGSVVDGPPVDVALEAVCRREYPTLVGALGLYCGDRDEAEDLAQEALVRLCQRWPLDGVENVGAWVMRVAFNLATSRFRRARAHERAMNRAPRAAVSEPDTAAAVAVRRAVRELPERQRRALVLRYYADLSVREVADHLSCPEGTVKTLTRQAIALLRAAGLEVDADD